MFKKLFTRSGQASVEYILLIVLISVMVFSLVSLSKRVKYELAFQKVKFRDKLAGVEAGVAGTGVGERPYKLSRSDFAAAPVSIEEGEEEGEAAARRGEAGVGEDRPGERRRRGARGEFEGLGSEDKRPEKGEKYYYDVDTDEFKKVETAREAALEEGAEYEEEEVKSPLARIRAKVARGEALTEEEKEEQRSLLLAKNLEETVYRREKSFREKDWSLWKILVVIALIIFFLIIIFKARRAKD